MFIKIGTETVLTSSCYCTVQFLTLDIFISIIGLSMAKNDAKLDLVLYTGFASNNTLVKITPVSSTLKCAFLCARNEECCTSTYHSTSQTCTLNSCCFPANTKPSSKEVMLRITENVVC